MKNSIITILIVLSALALGSDAVSAGGIGSHFDTGKNKSMMRGQSGIVFSRPERLTKLIGDGAINDKGEDLGDVSDFIIDKEGQISYLILDRSRIMDIGSVGIGSELVAIPITAVRVRVAHNGKFIVYIAKSTLDKVPTFSYSAYPDFSNKQWQQEVLGYFKK